MLVSWTRRLVRVVKSSFEKPSTITPSTLQSNKLIAWPSFLFSDLLHGARLMPNTPSTVFPTTFFFPPFCQQVRFKKRGTSYQPSNIKRKRKHGYFLDLLLRVKRRVKINNFEFQKLMRLGSVGSQNTKKPSRRSVPAIHKIFVISAWLPNDFSSRCHMPNRISGTIDASNFGRVEIFPITKGEKETILCYPKKRYDRWVFLVLVSIQADYTHRSGQLCRLLYCWPFKITFQMACRSIIPISTSS
ncbi:hypothetical protein G9A89_022945 [Geosiphon pyriformis]|nr:hypothetical protein G9A89_022945 [Geosiphon pyriformis]